MAPVAGTYGGHGGQYYCARAGCNTDLNAQCPSGELFVRSLTTLRV